MITKLSITFNNLNIKQQNIQIIFHKTVCKQTENINLSLTLNLLTSLYWLCVVICLKTKCKLIGQQRQRGRDAKNQNDSWLHGGGHYLHCQQMANIWIFPQICNSASLNIVGLVLWISLFKQTRTSLHNCRSWQRWPVMTKNAYFMFLVGLI